VHNEHAKDVPAKVFFESEREREGREKSKNEKRDKIMKSLSFHFFLPRLKIIGG
jgi:hypothetical protein